MLKKAKKGFTIVELVIVIAVIGILSAILIPTFANLTNQANDTALKSNLANAYSMYASEAADHEIEYKSNVSSEEFSSEVSLKADIEFVGQDKVFLVKEGGNKDSKGYVYGENGWDIGEKLFSAVTAFAGKEATTVADSTDLKLSTFGGFTIFYAK